MAQTDRTAGLVGNTAIKAPVRVATTGSITLSGEQTIDGVACVTGNRVLVKNQTTASENGIWVVDTGSWSRAADFDGVRDVTNGTLVHVTSGTVGAGTVWKQTTDDPTIGTSSIAFSQGLFSGLSTATFTQAGTGAEIRDAEGKMREEVTVLDFIDNDTIPHSSIADGSNSTNLAALINAALTAATGKTLRFTKGTYKISSNLTIPTSTDVLFDQGAIIDASAATFSSRGLIMSEGTLSSALGGGLASNVAAGARSITFNSAPSCSAGDLLIINNPTNGSWNPERTYYKRGEFLTVKSVAGSVVTLNEATVDAYTTASGAAVYKVTPTTTCITGSVEIRGNTGGTENLPTIYIDLGRNNKIAGLRLKNTVGTCIELSRCFAPEVANIDAGKHLADAGAIQSTGVLLNGVQYGWVHHCVLHADRHGASMGGSGGGYIVDRFNIVEDCELASTGFAAADFHAAAEFCTYRRNRIDGGINLSGARNTIADNEVYVGTGLTLINMEVVNSVDFVIERNRFYRTANGYIVDANDTTDINSNTIDDGVFRFRQNWIYDSVAGNANYLFIRNNGSTADCRLEFTDNHFIKTNTSFYGDVLVVSKVTGDAFASLIFEDNEMINCGIGSCHADDQTIAGNFVTQHSSNTRATTVGVDAGFVYFENNNTKGGGYISIEAIGGGAKAKLISFKGNTIRQNDTVIFPASLNNAEVVVSAGNTLGNPDITTQTSPLNLANIDQVSIVDDVYLGEGAPSFGSGVNGVNPSSFTFQRKVSVATPATSFTVFTVPANMSFMPTMVQGRCDTDVTATNGDFWGLGVVGANRLRDYGACSTAAATNKHSKNAKMRFVAAPSDSIQMADAADVIVLTSIATNADGAVAGSNIGGASQTITFRIKGNLVGNLPSLA